MGNGVTRGMFAIIWIGLLTLLGNVAFSTATGGLAGWFFGLTRAYFAGLAHGESFARWPLAGAIRFAREDEWWLRAPSARELVSRESPWPQPMEVLAGISFTASPSAWPGPLAVAAALYGVVFWLTPWLGRRRLRRLFVADDRPLPPWPFIASRRVALGALAAGALVTCLSCAVMAIVLSQRLGMEQLGWRYHIEPMTGVAVAGLGGAMLLVGGLWLVRRGVCGVLASTPLAQRCPACGYPAGGLPGGGAVRRCSECGKEIPLREDAARGASRIGPLGGCAAVLSAFISLAAATWVVCPSWQRDLGGAISGWKRALMMTETSEVAPFVGNKVMSFRGNTPFAFRCTNGQSYLYLPFRLGYGRSIYPWLGVSYPSDPKLAAQPGAVPDPAGAGQLWRITSVVQLREDPAIDIFAVDGALRPGLPNGSPLPGPVDVLAASEISLDFLRKPDGMMFQAFNDITIVEFNQFVEFERLIPVRLRDANGAVEEVFR